MITSEERSVIEELFPVQVTTIDGFRALLNPDIIKMIQASGKFTAICDRHLYHEITRYRLMNTLVLTKALSANFDIANSLLALLDSLTPKCLIFIDFHFVCEQNEPSEEFSSPFKLQLGSKFSCFNKQVKLVKQSDFEKLRKEIRGKTYHDFLSLAFEHHSKLYEYTASGFRPHQLVSILIHIQKF